MGASERRKGGDGERELVRLLREHLGDGVCRNLQQSAVGGHDLLGVGRFALEVKRCEKLSLNAWWEQAWRQAIDAGCLPALAYRQSRQPWRFVVPLSILLGNGYVGWPTATVCIDGFAMIVRGVE